MQVVPLQYLGMQLILAIYMAKYHTLKQRIQYQSMCFKKKKKKKGGGGGGDKIKLSYITKEILLTEVVYGLLRTP